MPKTFLQHSKKHLCLRRSFNTQRNTRNSLQQVRKASLLLPAESLLVKRAENQRSTLHQIEQKILEHNQVTKNYGKASIVGELCATTRATQV